MASHLASLWNGGLKQQGNGLLEWMDRAAYPFVASFMKMTTVALLMEKKQVSKVQDFLSLSTRSLQKSRVTLGTRMEKAPKPSNVWGVFVSVYLMEFYLPLSRDIDKDG